MISFVIFNFLTVIALAVIISRHSCPNHKTELSDHCERIDKIEDALGVRPDRRFSWSRGIVFDKVKALDELISTFDVKDNSLFPFTTKEVSRWYKLLEHLGVEYISETKVDKFVKRKKKLTK